MGITHMGICQGFFKLNGQALGVVKVVRMSGSGAE